MMYLGILWMCAVPVMIWLWMWMRCRERDLKLLPYLRANPGWHYGLDLVAAGVALRSTVYIRLGQLEEQGLVESTVFVDPRGDGYPLARPMYRATPTGVNKMARDWNASHQDAPHIAVCPNCAAMPLGMVWTRENKVTGCMTCRKPFTRNQWFGLPQADDYPGGPLDSSQP